MKSLITEVLRECDLTREPYTVLFGEGRFALVVRHDGMIIVGTFDTFEAAKSFADDRHNAGAHPLFIVDRVTNEEWKTALVWNH